MAQPDREVRGLRNDLREVCAAVDGRLLQLLEALGKSNVLAEGFEENLLGILSEEKGLPIRFETQAGPVDTKVGEGSVEVANPTDVSGVEDRVLENSETFNSTTWAIFGLIVGFGLLGVIFKLVRP